jgi:putative transposase
MPEYRRIFVQGGTYFFTIVTFNRLPIFSNDDACHLLRKVVLRVKQSHPFEEVAYCILPDHFHTLWKMPENDCDYPLRWRAIKGIFTRDYQELLFYRSKRNASRLKRRESSIWQRRYWEHLIRDDLDFNNHMDYIHFNPVKHGLVNCPREWKWSSFVDQVKNGYYPTDWCGDLPPKIRGDRFGE